MRRLVVLLSLLLLVPSFVSTAGADSVVPGNFVTFTNLPGSPGGAFGVAVATTPGGSPVANFVTFCVQMTEYIAFGPTFVVGGITTYAITDPASTGGINNQGQDPISSQTAWLYTQFRSAGYGALGNAAIVGAANLYNATAAAANMLQNAIWYFETELSGSAKTAQATNPYVIAAKNAVTSGAWSGIGNVRVMNLYNYNPNMPGGIGTEAQDQLVLVPEPSTLLLFGLGASAVFFARRRRASLA